MMTGHKVESCRTRTPFTGLAILLFGLSLGGCSFQKKAESPDDAAPEEAAGEESGGEEETATSEEGGAGTAEDKSSGDASEKAKEKSAAVDRPKKAKKPKKPKKKPRPKMSQKAKKAFQAGKKAFRAGDLRGARAQYKKAIEADSKAYQANFALGVVLERLGIAGNALKQYKSAFRTVPDHEESIVAYGILMARQGKPDAAMSFLKKKSNQEGQTAALLAAMAEVASLKGNSGQAQELAQKALKEDPGHKGAMVVLARDHYRARRIDLALYALTGILDGYGEGNPPRDKKNAEARMIRGLIYSERGMRGPAMEEMEAALKQRPDLVDAHLVLANYMMEAGNAKGARKHLEMAIRYDNKNVAAHLQLGDAYRLLNRPEDAKRELEWVLTAEPNQGAAHYNLGLLYLLGGKMKGVSEGAAINKALEHLEAYKARAQRGGPDDVDDLITRAKTKKALLKMKKQQKAGG